MIKTEITKPSVIPEEELKRLSVDQLEEVFKSTLHYFVELGADKQMTSQLVQTTTLLSFVYLNDRITTNS